MSLVDENGVSLVAWTLFRADYPSSPGARFSREPLLSLEVKKGSVPSRLLPGLRTSNGVSLVDWELEKRSVPSRFEALLFLQYFLKIKGVSLGAEGGKAEGLLRLFSRKGSLRWKEERILPCGMIA